MQHHLPASGRYLYRCEDQPTPISETWRTRRLPDGSCAIASTREVDGQAALRVFAHQSGGMVAAARCAVLCATTGEWVYAQYRRDDGVWSWRRRNHSWTRIAAQDNAVFFPLMRCFTGHFVEDVASVDGSAVVVVPWLHNIDDADLLMTPDISDREARKLTDSGRFSLQGGPYTMPAEVELRPDGLLSTYRWTHPNGQNWSCHLDIEHTETTHETL